MNYHSDEWIMDKIQEHYEEALQHFPEDRIVGIFCQGSTNYGLDTPNSDVDTKLIVLPTVEDIIFNRPPVSTTHVRANDEHIDFKDLRLMFQTFRKQNINFIEILFTKYKIINPMYADLWAQVEAHREEIAHYNIYSAVKAMKGMCYEKYHAMEHRYPAKQYLIDKYGYDGKQVSHLVRFKYFIEEYLEGKSYEECIIPPPYAAQYLIDLKENLFSLEEGRKIAEEGLAYIELITTEVTKESKYNISNPQVDMLLDNIQKEIVIRAIKEELK